MTLNVMVQVRMEYTPPLDYQENMFQEMVDLVELVVHEDTRSSGDFSMDAITVHPGSQYDLTGG